MSSVNHQNIQDKTVSLTRAKGVLRPFLNGLSRGLERLDDFDEQELFDLEAWFAAEVERLFIKARTDLL